MPAFVCAFIAATVTVTIGDPPLSDRDRFPPREVAKEAMVANRCFRRYAEHWQAWDVPHCAEWREVLEETDYLYRCWDWLHAAQEGEGRDEIYWRHSLGVMEKLLGTEWYQQGRMPPPVPVWRFARIE